MTQEKILHDLMGEFCGDDQAIGGIYVTDSLSYETGYRCFTGEGHSFAVVKEYVCEPEEVDEFGGVEPDGYSYEFRDDMDGFKNITVEDAIELLKTTADQYV